MGLAGAVARQEARPPSRGLFRAGGQTHDELESKFVVATKAVSSPPVTNALRVFSKNDGFLWMAVKQFRHWSLDISFPEGDGQISPGLCGTHYPRPDRRSGPT